MYACADELLELAERQLAQLPPLDLVRHYSWELRELRTSTAGLHEVRDAWLALGGQLPKNAVPGTEAYDEPLAESYAEAWHYLQLWTAHGQALIEINVLAQDQPGNGSPSPVEAQPVPDTATKPPGRRR